MHVREINLFEARVVMGDEVVHKGRWSVSNGFRPPPSVVILSGTASNGVVPEGHRSTEFEVR